MTIYADVLFAVNFIMDGIILWMVSKITRRRAKKWRLALGALCMALPYCLLVAGASYGVMRSLLASVLILSLGTAVALAPKNIKQFFVQLALGYVSAFAIGGLGMALFYLTDLPYVAYTAATNASAVMGGLSWKLVLVCVLGSYIAVKIIVRVLERIKLKRQMLCPVWVFVGGHDISFQALVDTGHSLRDPVSQAPVIIAEFEQVKPFLPEGLARLFTEKAEDDLTKLLQSADDGGFHRRLRMIPFNSLGRANGMLIGFKPDSVTVGRSPAGQNPGGETQAPRSDVVIGIYNNRLTNDGRYQGLLAPELVA